MDGSRIVFTQPADSLPESGLFLPARHARISTGRRIRTAQILTKVAMIASFTVFGYFRRAPGTENALFDAAVTEQPFNRWHLA
jgi:hypothetical protein